MEVITYLCRGVKWKLDCAWMILQLAHVIEVDCFSKYLLDEYE